MKYAVPCESPRERIVTINRMNYEQARLVSAYGGGPATELHRKTTVLPKRVSNEITATQNQNSIRKNAARSFNQAAFP